MSKEKQIEEMARILATKPQHLCWGTICDQCEFNKMGPDICADCITANRLYNAGYRKADEIALEVLGVIEIVTNNHIKAISMLTPQNDYCAGGKKAFDIVLKVIAELKRNTRRKGNEVP